jgi:hypothetical protein
MEAGNEIAIFACSVKTVVAELVQWQAMGWTARV